jgi:transcriptional regulator with XRE-family HTH domain
MTPTRNRVLRELRGRKGWSQERLAREAGVTTGTINKAERGLHTPTIMTQYKIARALGVEPSDIWPEDDLEEAS